MRGKIKFFNEDKGFGVIIDNDKIEYWFHVSKVKNKPDTIKNNDEVEFESFDTEKGQNAKNIIFIIKIKCPVCGTINEESEKNCTNEKCKFELTYAKDGAFVGLADNEIQTYNQNLKQAKEKYQKSLPKKLTVENLAKDMFETSDEYKHRIAETFGIIGKVTLETYDANNQVFSVRLSFDSKLQKAYDEMKLFHNLKADMELPREKAKELHASSKQHDLWCTPSYHDDDSLFIDSLSVQFCGVKYEIDISMYDNIQITMYGDMLRWDDLSIVYDRQTGLIWQDDISVTKNKYDWEDAFTYAKNLRLGGFDDWRLPTIDELKSIVNKKNTPTIKTGFKHVVSDGFWSSSPNVSDSSGAWYVKFNSGHVGDDGDKSGSGYVRCVRDSK